LIHSAAIKRPALTPSPKANKARQFLI
jgi:hypothetical protein